MNVDSGFPDPLIPTTETLELERLAFGVSHAISEECAIRANRVSLEVLRDYALRQMVYRVQWEWMARHETCKVYEAPATKWDAFKDLAFPSWLKKRFPVNKRGYFISAYEVLPTIELPDHMRTMAFYTLEDEGWKV